MTAVPEGCFRNPTAIIDRRYSLIEFIAAQAEPLHFQRLAMLHAFEF